MNLSKQLCTITRALKVNFTLNQRPITPEEIYDKCADLERKMSASILPDSRKRVYAGFDWGKKGDSDEGKQHGQSYSCGVVITADGPYLLSIHFATMLKRNDLQTKKAIVEQMFRQYSVNLAVGDIGYANDLSEILQKEYGDRFLASEAKSNIKNHVKFVIDEFPKTIRFERDYYIAELFVAELLLYCCIITLLYHSGGRCVRCDGQALALVPFGDQLEEHLTALELRGRIVVAPDQQRRLSELALNDPIQRLFLVHRLVGEELLSL